MMEKFKERLTETNIENRTTHKQERYGKRTVWIVNPGKIEEKAFQEKSEPFF